MSRNEDQERAYRRYTVACLHQQMAIEGRRWTADIAQSEVRKCEAFAECIKLTRIQWAGLQVESFPEAFKRTYPELAAVFK